VVAPFRIAIPDDVLIDLGERLARTRWPDQLPGAGWEYGTDLAYLQDLCAYIRAFFRPLRAPR
jgi:microsomal epoxide hydrolase